MSMQITHLGSGSRGNATLIRTDETTALIDCGFSARQIEKRLSMVGVAASDLDAIAITHHHSDHGKGAARARLLWGCEVHANLVTATKLSLEPVNECRTFTSLERVELGPDLSVLPIPVPHDGAENVGFILSNGDGMRAGMVTDLGDSTDELIRHLNGCSHISIESNYDYSRLMTGPYPDNLKRRITGRGGHLSNEQTATILEQVSSPELRSIVLCHLSEKNNAPHLAESETLMRIEGKFDGDLRISRQQGPEFSHWIGDGVSDKIALTL